MTTKNRITDLGQKANIDVILSLVEIKGKRVVDAGCGALPIAKMLADHGANVLAIDPDPVQAEKNRTAPAIDNIEFVETGAEKIPAQNDSIDGVFFGYSLHHVPAELYPRMFEDGTNHSKSMPTDTRANPLMSSTLNLMSAARSLKRLLRGLANPITISKFRNSLPA